MKIFENVEIIDNVLHIGGVSSVQLVKEYGTPLYVFMNRL